MESASVTKQDKTLNLRAWFGASIPHFIEMRSESVLGTLAANCEFNLVPPQRQAWLVQIETLRTQLRGLDGTLYFEFNIPRMGRRIDLVLIIGSVVFAVEFKVGGKSFDRAAIDQVWDYALDLKNFHEASHDVSIVPILVATEATDSPETNLCPDADKVYRPILTNADGLRGVLERVLRGVAGPIIETQRWALAPYHPTPTIVEAARALYAQHSVEAIARFDAGS